MAETMGVLIVESLVTTGLITEEISAFAAGSYLGIAGTELIGSAALIGPTVGQEFAFDIDHQNQTSE